MVAVERVLFVLDWFPSPQTGGTETQLWLLLRQLTQRGVAIRILLLNRSEFLEKNLPTAQIVHLGITRMRSARSVRIALRESFRARRDGFRLAHIYFNDAAILFPLPLKAAGLRVLVSRRDLGFWYSPQNLPWLRLNRRFVDKVVANCEAVKRVVVAQEGYPPAAVAVIYNGIESVAVTQAQVDAARAQLPVTAAQRIVLIVANARPIKRIFDLISAFAAVKPHVPDAVLVMAGADHHDAHAGHLGELKKLAADLHVGGSTLFLGRVADPAALIAAAAVCVLSSESEGLSNSLLEYARADRPIVCSAVGGNPEIVDHGRTGFTYPKGDVAALTRELRRVLEDPSLAREVGTAAGRSAKEKFSVTRLLENHLSLYGQVLRS